MVDRGSFKNHSIQTNNSIQIQITLLDLQIKSNMSSVLICLIYCEHCSRQLGRYQLPTKDSAFENSKRVLEHSYRVVIHMPPLRIIMHPLRIIMHPPSRSGLAPSGKSQTDTVIIINYQNYSIPYLKTVVIALSALPHPFTFIYKILNFRRTFSISSILLISTYSISISFPNIAGVSRQRLDHQNKPF